MQVSYGPPGQRGVTTLMAVGADELGETPTETAVRRGFWYAIAAAGLGALAGSKILFYGASGAAITLSVIQMCGDNAPTIPVTTPAPTPAGWWY